MNDIISFFFILSIFLVLVLYRFIRVGKSSLVFYKGKLTEDENYRKAEFFRYILVFIGYIILLYHSISYLGLKNTIFFFLLCIIISFITEIIGMETGFFFGGRFQYNNKKNGPMIYKVPLLILLTWFGLIYMGFIYSLYILNIIELVDSNLDLNKIILITTLSGILIMCLDFVFDPIAVDEKRWFWKTPGAYYGVPFLNFSGWFFNCFIILFIFLYKSFSFAEISIYSINRIPVYLFMALPLIASRPCFERGLIYPGIFGIIFSIILIYLFIT